MHNIKLFGFALELLGMINTLLRFWNRVSSLQPLTLKKPLPLISSTFPLYKSANYKPINCHKRWLNGSTGKCLQKISGVKRKVIWLIPISLELINLLFLQLCRIDCRYGGHFWRQMSVLQQEWQWRAELEEDGNRANQRISYI